MIDADGKLDFTHELLGMVEEILAEYEQRQGALDSDLKRGLAVSFVLGSLRCNLDAIWDELATAPHFAAQHPRAVFKDCQGKMPQITPEERERIHQLLTRYGWVSD